MEKNLMGVSCKKSLKENNLLKGNQGYQKNSGPI